MVAHARDRARARVRSLAQDAGALTLSGLPFACLLKAGHDRRTSRNGDSPQEQKHTHHWAISTYAAFSILDQRLGGSGQESGVWCLGTNPQFEHDRAAMATGGCNLQAAAGEHHSFRMSRHANITKSGAGLNAGGGSTHTQSTRTYALGWSQRLGGPASHTRDVRYLSEERRVC